MLFVAVDGRLGAGPWEETAAAVPRGASSSLAPGASSLLLAFRHAPRAPRRACRARAAARHSHSASPCRSRGAFAPKRAGTLSCVTNDASSFAQARTRTATQAPVPALPRCGAMGRDFATHARAGLAALERASAGANSMLVLTHLGRRASFLCAGAALDAQDGGEPAAAPHLVALVRFYGAPAGRRAGAHAERWRGACRRRHPPRAAARAAQRKPAAAPSAALTRARAWHVCPKKQTQRRSPPRSSSSPAAAIAIAAGSPVAYASATGPDGMPVGVVYHGSPVKNAQEARAQRVVSYLAWIAQVTLVALLADSRAVRPAGRRGGLRRAAAAGLVRRGLRGRVRRQQRPARDCVVVPASHLHLCAAGCRRALPAGGAQRGRRAAAVLGLRCRRRAAVCVRG